MDNKTLLIGAGLLFLGLSAVGKSKEQISIIDKYTDRSLQRGAVDYGTRRLDQITQTVVHHSAATNQTAEDYARYHVNHHRWPGIGYHYVIEKDGTIVQGNPLTNVSYHTRGYNTKSIGICLSGNFEIEQPTAQQMHSLGLLIDYVRGVVPNQMQVYGHRDFGSTSCPGDNLYNQLGQYKLSSISGPSDSFIYVGCMACAA
jgi:N-acetyl-anhydromuramyl-L-alanine amidase AmpD